MRNHLNPKFDRSRRWSRANPTGFSRPKRVSLRARRRAALAAWKALVEKAKLAQADPTGGARVDDVLASRDVDYSQLPLGKDTTGGK